MDNLLGTLLIGLIIGAVAELLMPSREPGDWRVSVVLGLAGSVLAGFFGRSLGWYQTGDTAGAIASVAGAVILLALWRLVAKGTRKPVPAWRIS